MADIYLAIIACRLVGAGAMSRRRGARGGAGACADAGTLTTLRKLNLIFVIGFFCIIVVCSCFWVVLLNLWMAVLLPTKRYKRSCLRLFLWTRKCSNCCRVGILFVSQIFRYSLSEYVSWRSLTGGTSVKPVAARLVELEKWSCLLAWSEGPGVLSARDAPAHSTLFDLIFHTFSCWLLKLEVNTSCAAQIMLSSIL